MTVRRWITMVLLVAALVGGFFMSTMASEMANGKKVEQPTPTVELITAVPLAPGEALLILRLTGEGQDQIIAILVWPGGRELAVVPR